MMRHRMRRVVCACGVVFAAFVATSCATVSDEGARASARALDTLGVNVDAPASPSGAKACDAAHDGENLTKSLRPLDQLPPPDSKMSESLTRIKKRGYLRVGVDDETLLLSYRNPETGDLEGFEWDLVGQIAQAIFGPDDPNEIVQANTVTTQDKVKIVKEGSADMTVSAVSMTCERWTNDVLFTMPYFVAQQKVLVRTNDDGRPVFPDDGSDVPQAKTVDELDKALSGRKVCWTAGSTSIKNIKDSLPHAVPFEVAKRTDCLKALQEGTVDAVSSHDTFLLGYHLQDPNTTIIDVPISTQTYAIAVSQQAPDLVRFLNRLLLDRTSTGDLERLYKKNFIDCAKCSALDVLEQQQQLQLPGPPKDDPQWLD